MKIALLGYGTMGKAIEEQALQRGHQVVLKITSNNLHELTTEALKQADVAIEFTQPTTVFDNITKCLEAETPIVVGTTGWYDRFEEMQNLCTAQGGTLFHSTNFSIGMNVFFEINKKLALLMNGFPQYNVHMHETHHVRKLDAPSGTAITLANQIIENLDRKKEWNLTDGENTKTSSALPITSHRIDDVPGTHEINYISEIDDITLRHTAHNRAGFAAGAVLAAEWIVGKKGIFAMPDLLKL